MPYTEQYIKEHLDEPKFRRCYWCKHYYTDGFCGYNSSNCWIYGSLDADQKNAIQIKLPKLVQILLLARREEKKNFPGR